MNVYLKKRTPIKNLSHHLFHGQKVGILGKVKKQILKTQDDAFFL
ncbi:hypothetical protein JN06_00225 [Bacteroides zoogleoformans]|nr:hypothetical protein JN06_00225 [Bacteroides zoogleoformans]